MTWPSRKLWCVSVFAAVLPFLFSPPARSQNTLNVPTDYPTIQSAINAANNGDTVLVTPGTYYENINFNGKFRLQFSSPAVDAGVNSAPGLPSSDFDGSPRIVDGNADGSAITDLGAYELQPTTVIWSPNSLTFNPQPRKCYPGIQQPEAWTEGLKKLEILATAQEMASR